MLKVLLVAPTDPRKPSDLRLLVGGENTFTKSLLANPPKNVKYTYFHEALVKGEIEYTFLNRILSILTKLRILPIGAGSQCLRLKSDFDLIHCHAYGIKIDRNVPIILSDSSSNYLFLRDYVNWPMWRIKIGYLIRKRLFDLLGVIDADTNPTGAKKIVVFSEFAKKLHNKLGVPESKMVTIKPGLLSTDLSFPRKRESITGFSIRSRMTDKRDVNILFVGTWFERKGGQLLLNAFERLSRKYKNIKLTIVGPIPKRFKINDLRFKNYDYLPREQLMRQIFPNADIFVLVPIKVEGFGFSVLEAMSFGIPAIVSNVCALGEIIDNGTTGFVVKPGNIADLKNKLEKLILDEQLRMSMGKAAKAKFTKEFSAEVMNNKLVKVYKSVLKNV